MIYLLHGENQFALNSRLNQLAAEHNNEHQQLDIERLDGEEMDPSTVLGLTAHTLFSKARFIVINSLSKNTVAAAQMINLIGQIPDSTTLVFKERKIKKNTSFYKKISKVAKTEVFDELAPASLTGWMVDFAKEKSAKIDRATANYLVQRVGSSQSLLAMEVIKLAQYDPKITKETINLLVEKSPQDNIFELLEAIAAGKAQDARAKYRELRQAQAEPYYVMSMISWQLSNMASVVVEKGKTNQQIATAAGMSPYVVQKTQRLCRNLDLKKIRKLYKITVDTDITMKTTNAPTDQLLEQLIDRFEEVITS